MWAQTLPLLRALSSAQPVCDILNEAVMNLIQPVFYMTRRRIDLTLQVFFKYTERLVAWAPTVAGVL